MAVTRATVESWYVNGMLTNKAQIDQIWDRLSHEVVPWTVSVDSTGLSADRNDLYVVLAADEDEAKRLAVSEHRGDWPGYEVDEETVEAYRLSGHARALGRLVPEDER